MIQKCMLKLPIIRNTNYYKLDKKRKNLFVMFWIFYLGKNTLQLGIITVIQGTNTFIFSQLSHNGDKSGFACTKPQNRAVFTKKGIF